MSILLVSKKPRHQVITARPGQLCGHRVLTTCICESVFKLRRKKRKTVTISSHGNTKKIHSHNSGKLGNVASFITLPPTPPLGRSPGAGDPEHRAHGPTVCACPPVWKRDSSVHGLGRGALWSAGQEWGPLLLEGDQGLSQVPIVGLLPARDKFGVGGRSGAELDLDEETDRRVRSRSGFRRRLAV